LLAVMSCPDCPMQPILFKVSYTGCPVPAALGYPYIAVLSVSELFN
jgi:hypothetical protein